MKYPPFVDTDTRRNMKEALTEQAYNNILEDQDRIEKYIEENSDVIQDILFKNGAYKNADRSHEEAFEFFAKIGAEIVANVILGIENMAEEDAENQL